ncbi:ABC transporter permease subunit [Rhodobacterales bacterium HKCCE3408]|nr:ABC transporter permease subunit [Rhodobacterales bacterium HKCCE3408]
MPGGARTFLLLAPALVVIGVLFLGGLGVAVLRSVGYMPLIGLTDPSLDAYAALLSNRDFYRSLALSLHISITSTLIASVIAVGAALLLRRGFAGRGIVSFLFQLNLTVPHLVGAIGILYLFSQSGSFARLGYQVGLIDQPGQFPALVYDPFAVGIILQYVWKEVPFIGLVVLAQMQGIGADYEAAARSLGARPWQAFRHVLLPLILPGLLASSAIVFAFTFGAYEIPALLGQSHPQALPVLAYRLFTDVDLAARPQAMAASILIAAISGVMVWAYVALTRRRVGG